MVVHPIKPVWDVIKSCEIVGSSDATIKNALANDLSPWDYVILIGE